MYLTNILRIPPNNVLNIVGRKSNELIFNSPVSTALIYPIQAIAYKLFIPFSMPTKVIILKLHFCFHNLVFGMENTW